MNKIHNIEEIVFSNDVLFIKIDSKKYEFELAMCSRKLLNASLLQKQNYIVSPSGYGIHWPMIDEDLSIDGLLGIKHINPISKKAG